MFRQSVVRQDRLSQSQLETKYSCLLYGFKVKDARRNKAEGTGLRGAACSVLVLRFFGCSYRLSYCSCVFYTFRKSHQANWAVVQKGNGWKFRRIGAKVRLDSRIVRVARRRNWADGVSGRPESWYGLLLRPAALAGGFEQLGDGKKGWSRRPVCLPYHVNSPPDGAPTSAHAAWDPPGGSSGAQKT